MMNQLLMSVLAQRKRKSAPQGETWVINESPTGSGSNTYSINFTSNGNSYSTMLIESTEVGLHIRYGNADDAYYFGWLNQAYRSVTFETAPTGDLLTWLQTNAVKQ